MKRLFAIAVILVCICALGVEAATTNEVSSINAVGYMRMTFQRDKFALKTVNFDMLDGNHCITNVLDADDLPSGTLVYLWDPVGQTYAGMQESLSGFGGNHWVPGTNMLDRGVSFWLKVPSTAPQPSYEVAISGQVPTDGTLPKLLNPDFSYVAFSYPVDTALTNSGLESIGENGDILYYWRDGWKNTSFAFGNWSPKTNVFLAGEGLVYKSGQSTNKIWNQIQPYSL